MKNQEEYKSLYAALQSFYDSSSNQGQGDPLSEFRGVRVLLEKRDEEDALLEKLEDEDSEEAKHKENMMEMEGGKAEDKVEEALDYLLNLAIERFGYVARVVFKAVFDFRSTTEDFLDAFNINFQQLKDAAASFSSNGSVDFKFSNRILVISPVYSTSKYFERIKWNVAFNSDWVAKEIMKKLDAKEKIEIRQLINFFREVPQAGSMVGSMFESVAHTEMARTGSWSLIPMVSGSTTERSPNFVVQESPDKVKLDRGPREIFNFKSVSDLLELDDDKYYVFEAKNFPLLDSFMVDLDYQKRSGTLWIFQVTKSQLHGGSAEGYLHIRKLISVLKKQLRGTQPPSKTSRTASRQISSSPAVNVCYVLVVLDVEGGPINQWQFPTGWNEKCTMNDHRGKVYCLEISLAALAL